MPKEFDHPLVVTTPLITGQRVKDAQYLMAGHSRFKGLATMKDAQIDGRYGEVSANATRRTKYWLGYPAGACTGAFGQTLYEYLRLNDWRPLPADYRERRNARLTAAVETTGKKALDFAIKEIGNHESPWGSNLQKYGSWFGFNGVPWCAIFESYCFGHTGWTKFHYAAVSAIYGDARLGRNRLREVWTPQPGDVACYRLHGDSFAHTAFFEKWIDQSHGTFYDVGGNTGPSNISNGGAVMRQVRSTSMVSHFVRVN